MTMTPLQCNRERGECGREPDRYLNLSQIFVILKKLTCMFPGECMFRSGLDQRDNGHMAEGREIKELRIEEDDLYAYQPVVRATVFARYEALYKLVENHNRLAEEGERPPDPRWAEIGVRVLKELSTLYRLHVPPRSGDDEDDVWTHGQHPGEVVVTQLEELEAKAQAA